MGALLACAYYAKGSALVFIPAFAIYYLWQRGGVDSSRRTVSDKRFLLGLALTGMLLLPWFVRNTICFGNPLFSTQNHVSGYIGWVPWEEGTYKLYWDVKPPSIIDKLSEPRLLARYSWRFAKQLLWWLFVRHGSSWGDFAFKDTGTYLFGLPASIGIVVSLVAAGRSLHRSYLAPPYGLSILIGCLHLGFVSICWEPIDRMNAPLIPLVMIAGWSTVWIVAHRLLGRKKYAAMLATACLLTLGSFWALHQCQVLRTLRAGAEYPWKESGEGWMEVGRWLRANGPGSVTMTRNPWELSYYSSERAVQIPLGRPEQVLAAARYYAATYLIPDSSRPELERWLNREGNGLRKVLAAHGVDLYEIRQPIHGMCGTKPSDAL
jgi:hypothetical protein